MVDDAAFDADLVRRARAARAAGDDEHARRLAAELWGRYESRARIASRRVARGAEVDEVFGNLQLRFVLWVYNRDQEPRHMGGLISQMATWAYGDVQRAEARQPVTVEEIDRTPYEDGALDLVLDRDEIARLVPVLSDRERVVVERMLEDAPDAEVAAELHGDLVVLQRREMARADFLGDAEREALQFRSRNRLGNDAHLVRFLAGEILADQRDMGELLHRQAAVQQSRSHKLAEGAAQDFRHAEQRVVGGVNEVVAVHDAERAAEAIAMYLRDHDAREIADGFRQLNRRGRTVPVQQPAVGHIAQEGQVEAR